MASRAMAQTSGGTVTPITLASIERYLRGLAQIRKSSKAAPYTVYPRDGQPYSLTAQQLATVMSRYGYSSRQIQAAAAGPGFLSNLLSGIGGVLPALGPEAQVTGGAVDLISSAAGGAELFNPAANDITPAEQARADEQAARTKEQDTAPAKDSTLGIKAATNLGTGGALTGIWTLLAGDAKYIGIWIGLMVLGIALLLMGLNRSGVKPPGVPIVVAA